MNVVSPQQVSEIIAKTCPADTYRSKKIVVIIPDGTRTAPVGMMFKALHQQIGSVTKAFDILIALGTHPPMTEEAICGRLEISLEERRGKYKSVQFFNHEWDNPAALKDIGTIPAARSFFIAYSGEVVRNPGWRSPRESRHSV